MEFFLICPFLFDTLATELLFLLGNQANLDENPAEYAARSAEEFQTSRRCVHGEVLALDCTQGCAARLALSAVDASTPRASGLYDLITRFYTLIHTCMLNSHADHERSVVEREPRPYGASLASWWPS
jgi:hypothetical protein